MDLPFFLTWIAQNKAEFFHIKRSSDSYFINQENKKIWDGISTTFQAHFGHTNEKIKKAIEHQLHEMPIAPPKAVFTKKLDVSRMLNDLLNLGEGKIFYTVSGAEANENALKMIRQIRNAEKVLARKVSYHGASLGALSVTGDWRRNQHLTLDQHTIWIPEPHEDPHLEKTEELIIQHGPQSIAGMILETITGANGVIIPERSWWEGIDRLRKKYGILLILDEVFCGFGRTAKNFAFQHFGQRPDFVTMAKGITGGYVPMGALWASKMMAAYYDNNTLSCGLTSYAHPLGLAACEAVMELLNDKYFYKNLNILAHHFWQLIDGLQQEKLITHHRTIGMLSVMYTKFSQMSWSKFYQNNIHLLVKDNYFIMAPPLLSKISDLDAMFEKIRACLTEFARSPENSGDHYAE